MEKVNLGARIFLGLIFFVFGLNGFLGFMPNPPVTPEAGALMGAFAKAGYFFPLLKATEVIAGLMLLANRFVPLALILLAPVIVQILALHVFLNPAGIPMGLILVALLAFNAKNYWSSFAGVLQAKA